VVVLDGLDLPVLDAQAVALAAGFGDLAGGVFGAVLAANE
jgi:hypothetical protein